MKRKYILLFLSLALLPGLASAQKSYRPFKAKVYLHDNMKKGYLLNVTSHQVLLTSDASRPEANVDTVDVSLIWKIVLRRKGKMGRDIAFVAIPSTIALGTLSAATNNYDPNAWFATTDGEAFAGGAIAGAFIGTIIGTVVGLTNNGSYKINGSQPLYDKYYPKLKEKCIIRE